jgi:23S rRNA (guanosine2251-2'-O)-methyltransferase
MGRAAGSGNAGELLYGLHAVREALVGGTRPLRRIVLARSDRAASELAEMAKAAGVPVHHEPRAALDRIVPDGRHQGVMGVVGAKAFVRTEYLLAEAKQRHEPPLIVVVDGVEDPRNLGAIVRSAEAAGAHGIVIPERRSVGLTATVAKASAGALEHLPVACVPNIVRLVEHLKTAGCWVYALDPDSPKLYTALDLRGAVALVVGGEGQGVRPGVLAHCDGRARIPMRGRVASLNVSVAASVVLFEAQRQRTV